MGGVFGMGPSSPMVTLRSSDFPGLDNDNPKTELALAEDDAASVRISSSGPRETESEIEARGKSHCEG